MTFITMRNMSQDYIDLIDLIHRTGSEASPRGMKTWEIEDVLLELTNPREAMPVKVGRMLSTKICAAETMQWLAGVSDLAQLDDVSRGRFSSFSDDGETLYGAYGPRARRGLLRAASILSDDPDSRRATVSIWGHDEATVTNDLPCTLSWGFRIRDGRLNMSTTMRSWDVFTGLAYDLPAMTRIQSALAWALEVEVGTYKHYAHSLHLYERNLGQFTDMRFGKDELEQPPMLGDDAAEMQPDPESEPWSSITRFDAATRWTMIRTMAENVVEGTVSDDALRVFPAFRWYHDRLKDTARHPNYNADTHYYTP